jgi:hypothetical protein
MQKVAQSTSLAFNVAQSRCVPSLTVCHFELKKWHTLSRHGRAALPAGKIRISYVWLWLRRKDAVAGRRSSAYNPAMESSKRGAQRQKGAGIRDVIEEAASQGR